MRNRKIITAITLVTLIAAGLWFYLSFQQGRADESLSSNENFTQDTKDQSRISGNFVINEKVPETTLIDFDGRKHKLTDYLGKAVILDFWAAWCPFCLEEMPVLQDAQSTYSETLVVIGVHRTDTENKKTALEFARKRGVEYLLISDKNRQLYDASGGIGMPVAVFIDEDGVVRDIKSGPKTKEEIKKKLDTLLKFSLLK